MKDQSVLKANNAVLKLSGGKSQQDFVYSLLDYEIISTLKKGFRKCKDIELGQEFLSFKGSIPVSDKLTPFNFKANYFDNNLAYIEMKSDYVSSED